MAPLHYAAGLPSSKHSEKFIQLLLDFGADIDQPSSPERVTPLHVAIKKNNSSAVKLLLHNGADTSRTDALGRSASSHARESGNLHFLHDIARLGFTQMPEGGRRSRRRRLSSCSGVSEYFSCSPDEEDDDACYMPQRRRRRKSSSELVAIVILGNYEKSNESNFYQNNSTYISQTLAPDLISRLPAINKVYYRSLS